ncbi:hypothetical protein EC919_107336 [Pseudomonas graminis]|nr:hypothetical protein EC919_107336 [Pseudomonas graminis]
MNTTAFSSPWFSPGEYTLRKVEPRDIHAVFAGLSHPQVIAHYGVSYASLEATAEQMHWFERVVSEGHGRWWATATRYLSLHQLSLISTDPAAIASTTKTPSRYSS